MAGNRKRHSNTVQVGSLLKWVVALFFLGVVGLSYVYLSNQMHARGNEISKREKELAELKVRNEDAEARVAQLSSRAVLQRRLSDGFIKMIAITDNHIERINAPVRVSGNELRAVANPEMEK